MNDLYVGAYWGARRESIDQCAGRVVDVLERLNECDRVFNQWFQKSGSRKNALKNPIEFRSKTCVKALLERGRHRTTLDRMIVDKLGFYVDFWNGESESFSASISINCGCYGENPQLRNSIVVSMPDDLGELAKPLRCAYVLKSVAVAWEPEWGGVISGASHASRRFDPRVPFVDWIVYVNRVDLNCDKLPPASLAYNVEGKGTMIVVQDQPICPASQHDLANVSAVASVLGVPF